MTALAATVGTGNIAGVATAIAVGGPGALFWMWITALVGMATGHAEVVLAVHYRETDDHGEQVGGPMYAIKNGLGKHWRWLGAAFALFGGLAGFGIGNMVQSNSIAGALQASFGIDPWLSGVVMTVLTGFVLLGGVKRIGAVAEKLVPFMCISYVVAALAVLVLYADQIPCPRPGVQLRLQPGRGHRWLCRRGDHDGDALWRGARHLFPTKPASAPPASRRRPESRRTRSNPAWSA